MRGTLMSWGLFWVAPWIPAGVLFGTWSLQTVQRAELWDVILAMPTLNAVHLGVESLNVVRHVGRLLDGVEHSRLVELENDGDLIARVRDKIDRRSEGTFRITKVKGHAGEEMVHEGQVRALDREGNNGADEAADFGWRRVEPGLLMLFGTSMEDVGSCVLSHTGCIGSSFLSPVLL